MTTREKTAITEADELSEGTLAFLQKYNIRTLEDVAQFSERELQNRFGCERECIWEIEYALETRGLRLRPDAPKDPEVAAADLDTWVARLVELCPHADSLTAEAVRAQLEHRGYDLEEFVNPRYPASFKCVLYALASLQDSWLYADDWKGPRAGAARAFERLLTLPDNTVESSPFDALEDVAESANRLARERGMDAQLYYLQPYDDDCVFALLTPALRDALVEGGVIAVHAPPTDSSIAGLQTARRSGKSGGMTDSVREIVVMDVEEFSNDAHNLIENLGCRTMGELADKTERDLLGMSRNNTAVVVHIKEVMAKHGLRLRM